MPDVKIRIVDGALTDVDLGKLMTLVQHEVARELECRTDDGGHTGLTPDQVDVTADWYTEFFFRTGATVLLEVQAYGYAARMDSIEQRMANIRGALEPVIPALPGRRKISTTFLAVPPKCWGISDE